MDSTKLAKRGGLFAVGWGVVDAFVTRVGTGVGLFTDFPGFSVWIQDKFVKAISAMSADIVIILIGCALLAWGLFGERLSALLGRRKNVAETSNTADGKSIAEAVSADLLLQLDATRATAESLSSFKESIEMAVQRLEVSSNAAQDRIRHMQIAVSGRAYEILIDKMMDRFNRIKTLKPVPDSGLEAHEDFVSKFLCFSNDLNEQSVSWPRRGSMPYQWSIDQANSDCEKEIKSIEFEMKGKPVEYETFKRIVYVNHLIEYTQAYLQGAKDFAVNLQRDFVDNPYKP